VELARITEYYARAFPSQSPVPNPEQSEHVNQYVPWQPHGGHWAVQSSMGLGVPCTHLRD